MTTESNWHVPCVDALSVLMVESHSHSGSQTVQHNPGDEVKGAKCPDSTSSRAVPVKGTLLDR